MNRSSPSEVLLEKRVLKICSKFTGEHPRRSVISIKLLCNFIEIALWNRCCPVTLWNRCCPVTLWNRCCPVSIFKTPFPKNTSGGLLLNEEQIQTPHFM